MPYEGENEFFLDTWQIKNTVLKSSSKNKNSVIHYSPSYYRPGTFIKSI